MLWGVRLTLALLVASFCGIEPSAAAEQEALDGSTLSPWWALPFTGLLLSIALLPQFSPRFWHQHFGKISAVWSALFLVPFAASKGFGLALGAVLHTALLDYLPFVILLFALFVISGGIRIRSNLVGTPAANTALLALGTGLASLAGTTGAAMLLVRPLIQANLQRRRNAHVLVFFIFLVANIGGSLTPLGDPPLFLGFLQGVGFGWTFQHMLGPMLLCSFILLGLFYGTDRWIWSRDRGPRRIAPLRVGLRGAHNLVYLAGAVVAVLVSGIWQPDVSVHVGPVAVPLPGLARDAALLILAGFSWATTKRRVRIENAFTWAPILEVIYLFAGLFLTILPALAILKVGSRGALAPLVALTSGVDGQPIDAAYFWLTGLLSSVLDNAPTYLVFFNVAGGDPQTLMGPLASTLLAISAGAVFMGAMTYIGNAPNFMIRAIASERGIRMPSFFGYVGWSMAVLLPLFVAVTPVFFWG
jgi:Na+/H+ antiporter NhaD/arsenite permease-like protein